MNNTSNLITIGWMMKDLLRDVTGDSKRSFIFGYKEEDLNLLGLDRTMLIDQSFAVIGEADMKTYRDFETKGKMLIETCKQARGSSVYAKLSLVRVFTFDKDYVSFNDVREWRSKFKDTFNLDMWVLNDEYFYYGVMNLHSIFEVETKNREKSKLEKLIEEMKERLDCLDRECYRDADAVTLPVYRNLYRTVEDVEKLSLTEADICTMEMKYGTIFVTVDRHTLTEKLKKFLVYRSEKSENRFLYREELADYCSIELTKKGNNVGEDIILSFSMFNVLEGKYWDETDKDYRIKLLKKVKPSREASLYLGEEFFFHIDMKFNTLVNTIRNINCRTFNVFSSHEDKVV